MSRLPNGIYLHHAESVVTGVGGEALTLKEAAQQLGVRPQRISQMLGDGDLTGPDVPDGGRAPKNMGRVWTQSLNDELKRRASKVSSESGAAVKIRALEERIDQLEGLLQEVSQTGPTGLRRAEEGERAARAAATRMKVALEVATESLLAERNTVSDLRRENADLKERLAVAEQRAETLDAMSQAFGDSLTQLLGADSPEGL